MPKTWRNFHSKILSKVRDEFQSWLLPRLSRSGANMRNCLDTVDHNQVMKKFGHGKKSILIGPHCGWGRIKHGSAEKKSQNESGCFYLFLSVPLSFWFSQQTLILLYCYTFSFYIKIIYIVVPVPQPAPLGLISANPDPLFFASLDSSETRRSKVG